MNELVEVVVVVFEVDVDVLIVEYEELYEVVLELWCGGDCY